MKVEMCRESGRTALRAAMREKYNCGVRYVSHYVKFQPS